MMYSLLKVFLFRKDAETAHYFVTKWMKKSFKSRLVRRLYQLIYGHTSKGLERELFGIKFPNPIGIAAGFDKEARWIKELDSLGFGFIEIGTLTPKGQEGNPKPRLFRLIEDEALVNRMGFNNKGIEEAIPRLKSKGHCIVGGNIGKNKLTDNNLAVEDYKICFEALYPYVDYFVVNVSSPNTPNLRDLQDKEPLKRIILALQDLRSTYPKQKAILLKIAPDLSNAQLDDVIDLAKEVKLDGLIACNTTISRANLKTDPAKVEAIGAGGVSGKPLRERSTEVIAYLYKSLGDQVPIIGVGGINSAEDAVEKMQAGAKLIQIYSGLIYQGPKLIKDIKKAFINQNL
ncbi:MAG: quinone-dependent dihydroorotate dehydrogenase [Flavobacteriales bacterium]